MLVTKIKNAAIFNERGGSGAKNKRALRSIVKISDVLTIERDAISTFFFFF